MRKLVATALVIAGTSSAAFAADLPARTAPVFAPPPPPVFTWSGGYFGINAGYAFDYSSRFRTFDNGINNGVLNGYRPAVRTVSSDGFTGGGQIGYNYQFGPGNGIVVGFEADAAYTDLGQTNTYSLNGGPVAGLAAGNRVTRLHTDMDFLGTVRGRIGYGFDRFMIYGTGGFAYGDVSTRSVFLGPNGNGTYFAGGRSDIQTGYTYGGGIEFAVPTESFLQNLNFFRSSGITIKAEYLHYDLGNTNVTVAATGVAGSTGSYTQRVKTDGDLARVGINYKF